MAQTGMVIKHLSRWLRAPATNEEHLNTFVFSNGFPICEMVELANWQTVGKHLGSNRKRRMRLPGHELREM